MLKNKTQLEPKKVELRSYRLVLYINPLLERSVFIHIFEVFIYNRPISLVDKLYFI